MGSMLLDAGIYKLFFIVASMVFCFALHGCKNDDGITAIVNGGKDGVNKALLTHGSKIRLWNDFDGRETDYDSNYAGKEYLDRSSSRQPYVIAFGETSHGSQVWNVEDLGEGKIALWNDFDGRGKDFDGNTVGKGYLDRSSSKRPHVITFKRNAGYLGSQVWNVDYLATGKIRLWNDYDGRERDYYANYAGKEYLDRSTSKSPNVITCKETTHGSQVWNVDHIGQSRGYYWQTKGEGASALAQDVPSNFMGILAGSGTSEKILADYAAEAMQLVSKRFFGGTTPPNPKLTVLFFSAGYSGNERSFNPQHRSAFEKSSKATLTVDHFTAKDSADTLLGRLASAHLVVVSEGNTLKGIEWFAVTKDTNGISMLQILRDFWRNNAAPPVAVGASAGSITWFDAGVSRSCVYGGMYDHEVRVPGLNVLPGLLVPHAQRYLGEGRAQEILEQGSAQGITEASIALNEDSSLGVLHIDGEHYELTGDSRKLGAHQQPSTIPRTGALKDILVPASGFYDDPNVKACATYV